MAGTKNHQSKLITSTFIMTNVKNMKILSIQFFAKIYMCNTEIFTSNSIFFEE